jgi:hypothetical protein
MKKSTRKSKFSLKIRPWRIAVLTTLIMGVFSSQAKAIDILQTISDVRRGANSLIEEFKNNPIVGKIVGDLNSISTLFMPEIQRLTNLSNADADKIRGVLGQLTPTEAKKAVENQQQPGTATNTAADSKVSRTTSELAADQVISKEAQETNKKTLEEVSGLVDDAEYEASDSWANAEEAQSLSSSQDVLKSLSRQAGNQAALTAAQVRIAAFQNNNLQEIKTQLAASNQANASFEKRQEGKAQEEQIGKTSKSMSIVASKIKSYEQ